MRILAVILLLIAYGSLYPGDFSAPPEGAVKTFLTDFRWFTSRGDVLGNIALFFPLGMASIIFSPDRLDSRGRIAGYLLLALVYAFALQLAQVWLPSRSAALADVVWNMTGMISGMAAAGLVAKRSPGNVQLFNYASLIPLSVLMLWLLTELLPLVPSLDLQKFKDALKPLLLELRFSLPETIMHAAGVFVAGCAFLALGRQPASWLGAALLLVMAGKLAVVNLALDASVVIGMLAGYAGCLLVPRLGSSKMIFEAAFLLLFAAWTITGVTPFSPAPGGTFNGVPFATMLQGSVETAARGLARSLFVYTALLWLGQKAGLGIRKTVGGLVILICLIELLQMGLLGRTADVTEPILLLLIGWVFPEMQSQEARPGRKNSTQVLATEPFPVSAVRTEISAEMSGMRMLGLVAAGIAITVAIAWLITKSALTPYNVRELVYEGHPFRSLLLLATLLYWAIGFPVLISQWLARGELYLLSLPPLVLLHGLIAWILLWSAVPTESLHDVVGSPVLGWPWEWELLGRFVALFSVWSVAAVGGSVIAGWRFLPNPKIALLGWAAAACLIMPLSYYVVVREASTDNLVELMAGNGSIGSFLLISLAVTLITFGGAKAALASVPGAAQRLRAAAWMLLSGILAYLTLYFGLEQVIVKYGQVFSAMQFLLSSDRAHLAGPNELIIRYTTLYGFVMMATTMVQYPLWRWVMSSPEISSATKK